MTAETTETTALHQQLNALADRHVQSEYQTTGTGTSLAWELGTRVRHGLIAEMTGTAYKIAAETGEDPQQLVEDALTLADWQAFADRRCGVHTFVSRRECGCAHRAASDDGFAHAELLRKPRVRPAE